MYLMDTIATSAALVEADKLHRRDSVLRVFGDIKTRLDGVPRFLLDGRATRTAVELNLGRPKVILEAMRHLRVPYTTMWFEWDDSDRQALRDKFKEEITLRELRPDPGRIGCLVEAAPDGRSGVLIWAWTTPSTPGGFCNVGAVATYFDLDRPIQLSNERAEGIARGNLAPLWRDNPVQQAALFDIWRYASFAPSAWGERFIAVHPNPDLMLSLAYSDVVGEWIMAIAVLLMLTASRPIVSYTEVSQAKLNKHRLRKRETPLFDHTRVTLNLSAREASQRPRQPLGYQRKSPRVHLVSAYLARRGDKHWIVNPYWRGEGETVSRHVSVRG